MAFEIDPRLLIAAVEKRPALYDYTNYEYKDRKLKKMQWKEVCQEVCSPSVWNSMSSMDKNTYGREIQKRWTSLRHCFRRELVAQKSVAITGVKKRKYIYFDSLLFLMPFTENLKNPELNENDDSDAVPMENEPEIAIVNDFKGEPSSSESRTPMKNNNDEEMITVFNDGNIHRNFVSYENEHDDDDLFFRSLIPYMKEFQGNKKLLLRMEIMKLILNFRRNSSNDNEA